MRIFIALIGISLALKIMASSDSFAEMTAAFAMLPLFLLYGLKNHLGDSNGESGN
jgi:hypothetical protein